MKLIILLIIIYLIWRHLKKKKVSQTAAKTPSSSGTAASAAAGIYQPPREKKLRGTPVTSEDIPRKWDDRRETSAYGSNPDLAFACSRAIHDAGLKEIQKDGLRLREDAESLGYCFIEHGVTLAKRYRDGYGCDCDPRAGIEVLDHVIQFYSKRQNNLNPGSQTLNDLARCIAEAHLVMADCYAMLKDQPKADKYYRMAYAMARCYGNPLYVKSQVIEHALGDMELVRPRPVSLTVAFELALSLAGEGEPMGGYYVMSCVELRKLDSAKLGQSWEQDYAIYSQAGGVYPLYRVGLAKVYGLGTTQDVKAGLELLEQAYLQGSIQAADRIYDYYSDLESSLRYSSDRADKQLMKQLDKLTTDWSHRYERMKKNPEMLQKIMDTGVANMEAAELAEKYAPKPETPIAAEADTNVPKRGAGPVVRDTGVDAEEAFNLSSLPGIVYDDSNRQWKRRGIYGDHAVYYNDDGEEVTIYSAQVSGSSASTSAGTLHWY